MIQGVAGASITRIFTKSAPFWASASAHPLPQIPTHTLRTIRVAVERYWAARCEAQVRVGDGGGDGPARQVAHAAAYPGPEEGVARGHVKVAVRDECGLRLGHVGLLHLGLEYDADNHTIDGHGLTEDDAVVRGEG